MACSDKSRSINCWTTKKSRLRGYSWYRYLSSNINATFHAPSGLTELEDLKLLTLTLGLRDHLLTWYQIWKQRQVQF
jgi:hypothetical protein